MNTHQLHLMVVLFCTATATLTPKASAAQRTLDLWRGDSLVVGWYDETLAMDSSYMVMLDDASHAFRNDTTIVRIFWDRTMSKIASEMRTSGDSVHISYYYRDGQLLRRNIESRTNMTWLYTEDFHPNGRLCSSFWPSLDTLQRLTRYYANGQMEMDGWWCGMRAFNEWTEWYEDGQLKLEARYERWPIVEPPYRMSLPIGEWFYYKPNGDLEKVEIYEDGKLKETRTK